jgi:hypothetical protein
MLPGQCPFYTMTSDDTMLMRESATRFIRTIPIILLIPLTGGSFQINSGRFSAASRKTVYGGIGDSG